MTDGTRTKKIKRRTLGRWATSRQTISNGVRWASLLIFHWVPGGRRFATWRRHRRPPIIAADQRTMIETHTLEWMDLFVDWFRSLWIFFFFFSVGHYFPSDQLRAVDFCFLFFLKNKKQKMKNALLFGQIIRKRINVRHFGRPIAAPLQSERRFSGRQPPGSRRRRRSHHVANRTGKSHP